MFSQNQIPETTPSFGEHPYMNVERKGAGETHHISGWSRICPHCGAEEMIPAGSCLICRNCGISNGCS